MAVFRVEKSTDYVVMSNRHLREKTMSLKAKGLLSWMLSNSDDWDYSISGIVANCKENETAVKNALKELQEFGYVEIVKHYPSETNQYIEYEYIVREEPIKVDSQESKNQGVENLPLENQVQRNTKAINTKNKNNNIISKDIIQKPKKKSLYEKCLDEIDSCTDNDKLKELLVEYLSIRLANKDKPLLGVGQWKGLLRKLKGMSDNTDDLIKIVSQSIEQGWASFYELKTNNWNSSKSTRKVDKNVTSEQSDTTEEDRMKMLHTQRKRSMF